MSQVVVVIGGGPLSPRALESVEPGAVVVAADSGLDHAVAAGLAPHHLVGDLDSISAAGRMWAYAHEISIDEHPPAKDETDTELALALAATVAADGEVLLLGGAGDRLDHTLATVLALGRDDLAACRSVRAVLGDIELVVVHPGRRTVVAGDVGRTFSVLALHGPCTGVTVRGARWELFDAALAATEGRGVSNEMVGRVTVEVTSGVLTVVLP